MKEESQDSKGAIFRTFPPVFYEVEVPLKEKWEYRQLQNFGLVSKGQKQFVEQNFSISLLKTPGHNGPGKMARLGSPIAVSGHLLLLLFSR